MSEVPEGVPAERRPAPRALLISLALLAAAGAASLGGNIVIVAEFPDRPAPRDLLFELLPYVGPLRYMTAIALIAGFALFVRYAFRRAPARIPEFIAMFAIMYLLRAAFMVLTPLASAHGEGAFVSSVVQYGMFPSGHIGAAVLLTRLTARDLAPVQRRVQAVLALVLGVSMILAHGHYSIDIVGGVLLSYFIEQEWTHGRLFNPLKRAMEVQ